MKDNREETINKYKDIIYKPYVKNRNRLNMKNYDRAAQFSPFAALTGHSDAIEETARQTETEHCLDENVVEVLNIKLSRIIKRGYDNLPINIRYFLPDSNKAGGKYVCHFGSIKKIDDVEGFLLMDDGTVIYLETIIDIQCDQIDI